MNITYTAKGYLNLNLIYKCIIKLNKLELVQLKLYRDRVLLWFLQLGRNTGYKLYLDTRQKNFFNTRPPQKNITLIRHAPINYRLLLRYFTDANQRVRRQSL